METLNPSLSMLSISCSYPTYEEWKPSTVKDFSFSPLLCSYPTYEEWKHLLLDAIFEVFDRSYPTYEEWKLT